MSYRGWCQFKVAYLLPVEGRLTDLLSDGVSIFSEFDNLLPKGWAAVETCISGAAGYVVVFDVDTIPTQKDLNSVEKTIFKLDKKRTKK